MMIINADIVVVFNGDDFDLVKKQFARSGRVASERKLHDCTCPDKCICIEDMSSGAWLNAVKYPFIAVSARAIDSEMRELSAYHFNAEEMVDKIRRHIK